MKAIRHTLAAALTVFAAASCQDNIAPEQNPESGIIINATIENTQTKTVLGEGVLGSDGKVHHKVLWNNSDDISVFDANGNNKRFKTYVKGDHETAKFQQIADDYDTTTFVPADYYHAIYPGKSSNSINMETKAITTTIPDLQRPVLNSFADDLAVAYGFGTTQRYEENTSNGPRTYIDMTFKNATALIKIELTSSDITEVRFLDQNNNYLGGTLSFTYQNDEIQVTGGDKKYIFLNKSEEIAEKKYKYTPIEPGVYYIVIAAPATPIKPRIDLHTATTHTSSKINGNYPITIKGKNEVSLKPGMILDLGRFDASGRVTE